MKTWFLLVLAVFLFILSCSEQDLTGRTVADVSTLTVIVRNENGSLMYGAHVYVNDEYKGSTNKYGELRGTKEIVLPPGDNDIYVEAPGYVASETQEVSGAGAGQRLTFILHKPKTDYTLLVYNDEGALQEVKVTLSHDSQLDTAFTNEDGEVQFLQLEDGEYIVKLQKGQHTVEEFGINISRSESDGTYSSAITLEQDAELAVEVASDDGTPLPGAEVSLYEKDDYNSPGAYPIAAKFTKEDGKVYFRNVEYGEVYILDVRREGFEAQQRTVEFTPGHDTISLELDVD